MKYVVLLLADGDERPWAGPSLEEQRATMGRFETLGQACAAREGVAILTGEALAEGDAATTVRHREGRRTVADCSFAEVVEGHGGFYLLEAPHLDVVPELIDLLPSYDMQISPVADLS